MAPYIFQPCPDYGPEIRFLLSLTGSYATSGDLYLTGSLLQGQINNLLIGTPSNLWQLETGASGIQLKNTLSGLYLRNYNDSEPADLTVRNLTVLGTGTIINTNTVNSTQNYLYLNESGVPRDGGIYLLRSGYLAAGLIWDELNMMWRAGFSGIEQEIILASHTGQFASKTSLTQTGIDILNILTDYSGYSSGQYATTGEVYNTGTVLQNQITNLNNQVYNSGQLLFQKIENTGNILSNSLFLTGKNNYLFISGVSGFYAPISGILNTKIDNLSGYAGSIYATINSLFLTGSQLSTRIDLFSGYSDNKFATIVSLENTGSYLYELITGIQWQIDTSGVSFQSGLDALSGWAASKESLQSTGQQNYDSLTNNAINLSGKLHETGYDLILYINASSGVLSSDLFLTGSGLVQYVNVASGYLQAQINDLPTTTDLENTGSNLYRLITGLSGLYEPVSGILDTKIDDLSGYAENTFATTLRLFFTGSNLSNKINSLSGYCDNTFATKINLELSGSSLFSYISYNSGALENTGSILINAINSLSGYTQSNLYETGNTLNNRINSLSGYINIINSGVYSFTTGLNPTGYDLYYINYPVLFSQKPNISVNMELTQSSNIYGLAVSGNTSTGFFILFTDTIDESGVLLNVLAKV